MGIINQLTSMELVQRTSTPSWVSGSYIELVTMVDKPTETSLGGHHLVGIMMLNQQIIP